MNTKNKPKTGTNIAIKALRSAGMKVTQPRIRVFNTLLSATESLSNDDIYKKVKLEVDRVTVYRILDTFVAKGIVRQVDLRHGHAHYEIVGDTDHHHLVCVECKTVERFQDCDIESLTNKILKKSKSFNSISDHTLELFGVCSTCKENI